MKTNEQLFRETLQVLAAEGNEKAKLALSLASPAPLESAVTLLTRAHQHLGEAIRANATDWTKKTDTCIVNAQQEILKAVSSL